MSAVDVVRGSSPVVLGLPHTGTHIPSEIADRLTPRGQALADTDWHVDQLYDGLMPDITTVRTTVHRYVIDVNRDPSGASLYPGQNTTGLVPLTDFDGQPLWRELPDHEEIDARITDYHAPYHAALSAELARVRALHGVVILYDCHSIRSEIGFLFDGILPDFNIGTNLGTTCAASIETLVAGVCQAAAGYRHVVNGRFKGGWTTRNYGMPAAGCHAIQMELAQSTYLEREQPPWTYDVDKAARLRPHLAEILRGCAGLAPTLERHHD